jgi:hypothetical protein
MPHPALQWLMINRRNPERILFTLAQKISRRLLEGAKAGSPPAATGLFNSIPAPECGIISPRFSEPDLVINSSDEAWNIGNSKDNRDKRRTV